MPKLKYLLLNRRGNFAVAAALMAVPLGLALGLSIDFTNAVVWKSKLQEIADSAAIAAVENHEANEQAVQVAKDWALANRSFVIDLAVDANISTPAYALREVVVEISARMPTLFMNLAGIQTIELHVAATARKSAPDYCIYALDPDSDGTMAVIGSGGVSVSNCGVQVNSSSANALRHVGTGKIVAGKISVVGDYQGGGYSVVPKTNQPLLADPLVDIPEPVPPRGCDYNNQILSGVTIPAGRVFCGSISFDGDVILSPGVHYFHKAVVSVDSNADLKGDEVTIYLDSGSSMIQSPGNGSVRLSAPKDGIYAGLAIFGSRELSDATPALSFSGNKNYRIDGTIYLPRHRIRMKGTHDFKLIAKIGWIVAWQFLHTGNSSVSLDISGTPPPNGLGNSAIVLFR
ncbi:MAG: pilus assembly protein [Mesorhizobium sp.]|uniref:TadE/TadG family type IV pilus assembly protein n=1 Tax=Mesorhizobium sp. TaxID=1871066 RepID=UPI0011F79F22|nr:TadE/TadG family type IV pilus assembly protein [Mesorhizobium sp.]TIT24658.1 MAG: pilus assembly protein [Mesorhizobium sp.]TIX46686.1 MAG: pilus assembly protein [Mesorhizobium sp.]